MAKHKLVVTQKREERLPDWSAEYVMMIHRMRQLGVLDEIAERLQVPREGGYSDADIVVFLLCFLCSHIDSQKRFGRRSQPYRAQLAAVADREQLASPSSASRYLNSAGIEHVQPFVDWLLLSRCDDALFSHERTAYRDSHGKPWWVFDWDPTVLVMRKRGLPDKESLPEAKRRAARAEPGYSGRKRGEKQFCRSIITQAGSAQPVGAMLQPGNGQLDELIAHAVQTVRQAAKRAAIAPRRALLRVDGVGGCVPFISQCKEAGVRFLTRFSRYHWLKSAEIEKRLGAGQWQEVTDSGSGPRREALDLGRVKIHPDRRTKKADGSPYEPVRARVIVSRFKPLDEDSSRGAGKLIDGWHYEMYVTDLQAQAWPAADTVALYYGRSGCENYYAQMNREMGLNRLFCYEPAGQLLVTALALWLFGEQARWGAELDDEAAVSDAQTLRAQTDDQARRVDEGKMDVAAPKGGLLGASLVDHVLSEQQITEVLERFDDSWRWDPSIQGLICANDQPLTARKIRGQSLIFSPTRTACRDCRFRQDNDDGSFVCTRSTKIDFRKEVSVALKAEQVQGVDLDKLKEIRPEPRHQLEIEVIEARGGKWHMAPPSLFPANWRSAFRQACEDVEVEVELIESTDASTPIRSIAEIRQRRRLSFEQRHLGGALRDKSVHLTMRGGPALKQLICTLDPDRDHRYLFEDAS